MSPTHLLIAAALAPGLAPPAVSAATWHYTVGLLPEAGRLTVAACSAQPQSEVRFGAVSRSAPGALRSARRDTGSALSRSGTQLSARGWQAGECLRYAVDLPAAVDSDRWRSIRATDGYWLLSPNRWLWRPDGLAPEATLQLDLPAGWSASLPWRPLDAGGTRYRLGATPSDWPALTAFGRFEETAVELPGGRLRLAVLPSGEPATDTALRRWVGRTAAQLPGAFGRLPVPDAQLLVVPLPGSESPAPWAEVTRGGGAAIHLYAGMRANASDRDADWTLTHELAHLLHPYLGGRGRWLSEGLGSYYQNLLRARAGALSAAEAWRRLDAGFGRGRSVTPPGSVTLVEASERRGSVMRLYWSGAAFWLEADLALRQRGDSLDALLGRFAAKHLPSEHRWTPERFVAALDALVGAPLLAPQLARYAARTDFPDLSDTYAELGLRRDGRGLRFGEAPASAIRHAIMAPVAYSSRTPGSPTTKSAPTSLEGV